MLLVFDIGNTNITMGCYYKDKLLFVSRLATEVFRKSDQYAVEIKEILNMHIEDNTYINGAIISSVVPQLTDTISESIKLLTNTDVICVNNNLKTGLVINIDDPSELGADLIVGCVAAKNKFKLPCIVFDIGTATTICVIDENGCMIGGTIMPGLEISLEALMSRAALLNTVYLKEPKELIGKNTNDCICSGIIFGTASMIDGMIERIQEYVGKKCSVVATGGLAGKIVKHSKTKIEFCENLLLEGLKLIYDMNKEGEKD